MCLGAVIQGSCRRRLESESGTGESESGTGAFSPFSSSVVNARFGQRFRGTESTKAHLSPVPLSAFPLSAFHGGSETSS
jgi:hypothetical protein